jgi:MFS transporter, FSR family, fosmidomycin resistance protein
VLLPLWQAQFGLSYAAIGVLRALYAGVMAGLQVPTAGLAQRVGGVRLLAIGTAIAAIAYLLLGASSSIAMLAVAFVVGGIGSSTQHPIASSLVAEAYQGSRSRGALGAYNFAGDLGKMVLPAITAGMIALMSWRSAASVIGIVGLLGAGAILLLLRPVSSTASLRTRNQSDKNKTHDPTSLLRNGFPLLLTIGVIDSATRMGFLTFLPFLLQAKGAGVSEIGMALSLVFAGGAAGKLVCGFVLVTLPLAWQLTRVLDTLRSNARLQTEMETTS